MFQVARSALLPIELLPLVFRCMAHMPHKLRNPLVECACELLARRVGILEGVVQERGRDDVVPCSTCLRRQVFCHQERDRKEVGDIGQGLGLRAEVPVMLPRRELYRLLYLRRVVHATTITEAGARRGVTPPPPAAASRPLS